MPMRMGGTITSRRRGNRRRRRTISSRKGISSRARQPMKMPYRSEGTSGVRHKVGEEGALAVGADVQQEARKPES